MSEYTTTVEIETDGLWVKAPTKFDCEEIYADSETGDTQHYECELVSMQIGGLELSRSQVRDMIGKPAMDRIEEDTAIEYERDL